MKVLVTGATGFLGSHLVDRLLAQGDEVHVLSRKTSNLRWLKDKPLTFHEGDVTGSLEQIENAVSKMDIIYHVAGVVQALKEETYFQVNAFGTKQILDACLRVNPQVKRIVIVTSLAAHGPGTQEGIPAKESDRNLPVNAYGQSKLEAEKIAAFYMDKIPITIIRPPAIYGPRDEQFLSLFKMVQSGIVILPGLRKKIINACHVQDVVSGIILAALSDKAVGEIFFIGNDKNYSWEEAAVIFSDVIGKKVILFSIPSIIVYAAALVADFISHLTSKLLPLSWDSATNFIQKNWMLDISKAKELLEYKPQISLHAGVENTYHYLLESGTLKKDV
ncbi:MAG: NAD(P)-dependent oxidoreductase [Deltaproteobacteria bacterium]|nr:MAG: NAD(P)-dependent oxidoreductase [Deltaproteobacteria bacterium]